MLSFRTRMPQAVAPIPAPHGVVAAERDAITSSTQSQRSAPAPRSAPSVILWIGLPLLFVVALALRVYGIAFGLPHLYYWDEPTVVNRAIRFATGDLNPHFFNYPTLYFYVLFGMSGLYFLAQLLIGKLSGPQDFGVEYFIDPSGVYLTARLTTAVIGALCVLAIFFVARRYFGSSVGFIAALYLAVSVNHATQSHVAVADVPQSLAILLALLPIQRIMDTGGRRRDYALAGLLIGLGAATKYFAILLAPSLIAAHLLSAGKPLSWSLAWQRLLTCGRSPSLVLAGTMTVVGFFVGSPYAILDFGTFLSHLDAQTMHAAVGDGGSADWFLAVVLPASLGWPMYLLAILGLTVLVVRREIRHLPWIIFVGIYFYVNSRAGVAFARYMIPVELFLCMTAAFATVWMSSNLAKRVSAKAPIRATSVTLALTGLALLWPLSSTLRWDYEMSLEADPRTASVAWMERNVEPGTVIAVQSLYDRTFLNAPVMTDLKLSKVSRDLPQGGSFDEVRRRVLAELGQRHVFREIPFVYDYDALQKAEVRYILVSNLNWLKVERGAAAWDSPEMRFKRDLDAKATLVGCFRSVTGFQHDARSDGDAIYPVVPPTIRIYRVGSPDGGGADRQHAGCNLS